MALLPIMRGFNHLGDAHRVPFELKATINLPKTAFPMKANLPQNEPKMLARWEQERIYERIREARRVRQPTFCTMGRLIRVGRSIWALR